jgi:hypothetical protein
MIGAQMRKHMITRAGSGLSALALTACMALAGCKGSTPAAGPAPAGPSSPTTPAASGSAAPAAASQSLSGIQACALVPASVVAQVLGTLTNPPDQGQNPPGCIYNTAVPGGEGPSYILTVFTSSGYQAAKALAMGEAQAGTIQLSTVSGLGQDAFAFTLVEGGPEYTLSALDGSVGVSIEVNDVGPAEAKTRELVAAALPNL